MRFVNSWGGGLFLFVHVDIVRLRIMDKSSEPQSIIVVEPY